MLELEVVGDGLEARLGAGLVVGASGSARNADPAEDRAARLDEQAASDGRGSGNMTQARHYLVRTRHPLELRGAHLERGGGPRLVGGEIYRMRAGEPVAEQDLRDAGAIDDRDGDLETVGAALRERRLGGLQRRLGREGLGREGGALSRDRGG